MGHATLAWRDVPTDNTPLGKAAKATEPMVQQWFISGQKAANNEGRTAEQQVCLVKGYVLGRVV